MGPTTATRARRRLSVAGALLAAVLAAPSLVQAQTAEVRGTVTDNTRVGLVEVAIQDRVTKLWWDARIATWSTTKQWTSAGVKGSSATSMQWWFPFIGAARRHDYALQVRAIDAAGVIGSSVSTLFTVSR